MWLQEMLGKKAPSMKMVKGRKQDWGGAGQGRNQCWGGAGAHKSPLDRCNTRTFKFSS